MNKGFIPYELALALKETGFNEPCSGYYNGQGNYIGEEDKVNSNCNKLGMHGAYCTAPTFSQAFKWFREKYQLYCGILTEYSYGGQLHAYHITGKHQGDISKGDYKTYEEAELACLRKLIEIVKNK